MRAWHRFAPIAGCFSSALQFAILSGNLLAFAMASSYINFDMGVPIVDRVSVLSPIINAAIEEHDSEDASVGVEAFTEDLLARIRAAGLMEKKWIPVEKVGVHPDNREKAMLVPIDVHDLLKKMAANGWSYAKWDALACEIPTGDLGKQWREENEQLAKASDGLLAPYHGDMLSVLTGRGSHGTAAIRAMKMGAKGIHPEVCADGFVSKSKICERQPSMEQPLSQGCPYEVIKAELVIACPRLMEVLSRTGNAGHSVYRVATALQHCNRIHHLAASRQGSGKAVDWDAIAKQACIGMGDEFLDDAKKLSDFVRVWSGGEDGHVLKDLELYERTLRIKRKLYPHDLQALSKVDFIDGNKYIPAMVKAMLNAPIADSTGHASLFTNSDYSSIQPNAKARPFAKEANSWMDAAESFLSAYSRFQPSVQAKLLSDFEVRCVMHVHQKRCETRVSYKSFQHIAKAMYDEAKALDDKLPIWNKVISVVGEEKHHVPSGSLREIRKDGLVPDGEMVSRGFVVGAKIMKKEADASIHTIVSMGPSPKSISVKAIGNTDGSEGASEELLEIDRHEVLSSWAVQTVAHELAFNFGEYPDPSLHNDLLADVWKGHIKSTLAEAFKKSSEANVTVYKEPALKVVAGKAFKQGALSLVGLTNNITIASGAKISTGVLCLGECFEHSSNGTMKAYARPHLQFPSTSSATGFARNVVEPFIVAYWACPDTFDQSRANCQQIMQEASVKIGTVTHKIKIPTITNTKPLQTGDEIVVLKCSSEHESQQAMPDAKRHKSTQPPQPKKGKSKGKGKSSK